jgi:NADH:ubiquinone oxidoreductase subunit 3 (subunit A)
MELGVLSSPLTIFVISLIVSIIIYAIGTAISPKSKPSKGKLAPYACGEDIPAETSTVSIHLFKYAALFMIFDSVAMVIAFSFAATGITIVLLSAAYCIPILIALLLLIKREE